MAGGHPCLVKGFPCPQKLGHEPPLYSRRHQKRSPALPARFPKSNAFCRTLRYGAGSALPETLALASTLRIVPW